MRVKESFSGCRRRRGKDSLIRELLCFVGVGGGRGLSIWYLHITPSLVRSGSIGFARLSPRMCSHPNGPSLRTALLCIWSVGCRNFCWTFTPARHSSNPPTLGEPHGRKWQEQRVRMREVWMWGHRYYTIIIFWHFSYCWLTLQSLPFLLSTLLV